MKISSLLFSVTLGIALLVSSIGMAASPPDQQGAEEARTSAEQKNISSSKDDAKNNGQKSSSDQQSAKAKSSADPENDNVENIEPAAGQGDTKTPTTLDEMRGIY